MAEVRFGRRARRQLDAVSQQRREQAGGFAATRLRAAFDRFFATVRDFPRVGTVFHQVGEDEFRQFPVERYIVRFRVRPSGDVAIVDVRHGQMREPTLDVLEQEADQADQGM